MRVDSVDDLQQLRFGLDKVITLFGQELIPLLGLLVLRDGHQVDRPHFINASLQCANVPPDFLPIGRHAALGHFFRRQRVDLGRAFVGQRDRDAFAANVVQIDLVLFADAVAQILHDHAFLRQFDFMRAALLLQVA